MAKTKKKQLKAPLRFHEYRHLLPKKKTMTKKELQELGQRLATDLTQDDGRSFKDHLSDLLDGLGLKNEAGNIRALNWAGGGLADVAGSVTDTLWNAAEVEADVAEAVGEKDEEIEKLKTKRDEIETERDDAKKYHDADVAEAVAEAEKERDEERIEHEKDMAEAEKSILKLEGEIEDLKKVSTLPTGSISGLVSLAVNHEGEARREGYDDAVKFLQAVANQPHLGIEYVCWVMNAAKIEAAELIAQLQGRVILLEDAMNGVRDIALSRCFDAPEPATEPTVVEETDPYEAEMQDKENTEPRVTEVDDCGVAERGHQNVKPPEARLCAQCKEFFGSEESKPLKNRQGKVFCTGKCRRNWNKENK